MRFSGLTRAAILPALALFWEIVTPGWNWVRRGDAQLLAAEPGGPEWLVGRMNEALPEMFHMYGENFGESLPFKPVVLFNFEAELALSRFGYIDDERLAERRSEALNRCATGLAAAAMRHLMSDACDGRVSFYTEGRRLRTEPLEDCEPFSKELRVHSIEGHEFGPEGDLAFEAAAARCSRGETVTLGLEDGTKVEVPCESPAPPEPAPLTFPPLASG